MRASRCGRLQHVYARCVHARTYIYTLPRHGFASLRYRDGVLSYLALASRSRGVNFACTYAGERRRCAYKRVAGGARGREAAAGTLPARAAGPGRGAAGATVPAPRPRRQRSYRRARPVPGAERGRRAHTIRSGICQTCIYNLSRE